MSLSASRLTEYLAQVGLAVLGLAVAMVVAVLLVVGAFPHLLDGPDVAAHGDVPNYARNLFELLSFVSAAALVTLTGFGFFLALRQAKELEKTRLAAVYAQIEARWSSKEMIESRVAFRGLVGGYFAYLETADPEQGPARSIAAHFDAELNRLSRSDFKAYVSVMVIADYLEFIGMLESKSYLAVDDVAPLMGELCVYAHDVLSAHLEAMRDTHRQRAQVSGHPGAPQPYAYFTALADTFTARFARTAG